MNKEYLTVREVSALLQVHWHTVLSYIKNSELEAIQLKREYRISKKSFERFVTDRATKAKEK